MHQRVFSSDSTPKKRLKVAFMLFFQLLFTPNTLVSQTSSFFFRSPQVDAWTPEIERLSFLIKNKAFLNNDALDEATSISRNLSRTNNEALLEFYMVKPGFLLSPPTTKFAFAPLYEDMTPKYVFGAVGVIGTGLFFYAAMIGANYDSHLVNIVEGSIGFSMSLSAWVYFMGLPIWEPKAYDRTTVNRELVEILVH